MEEEQAVASDSDVVGSDSDKATLTGGWREPVPFPRELERPVDVQQILRSDTVPPAETLLHASDYDLGTEPLDASRYYSREFHDKEVASVWSKAWQCAAWSHDIPRPGDISVYDIVDRSVILVRQRDMSVKAFVNSCLHRGRKLCDQAVRRNQLRCPYHGFTWGLDGALTWVPAEWDFPQIEPAAFGLPEVRVDEWNGFFFVNFDADAPPLKEYMGAMYDQWGGENPKGAWDFSSKYKAVHLYREMNCNWKVGMEGFIEALHVWASHPQIAQMNPESSCQYDVYADEPHFSRFHALMGLPSHNFRVQPTDQEVVDTFTASYVPEHNGTEFGKLREGETARQAFARISKDVFSKRLNMDVSGLADAELIDGTEYLLFPNILPWPSIVVPLFYRFRPKGNDPDWCIWETMLFMPFEGERPPSCEITYVEQGKSFEDYGKMGALDKILQQDAEQLPLVQQGLKASATQKVELARYQEARIRHYHQTIDSYISRQGAR